MPGSDFERRLEAAQAGDEGSFTELFRSLQPSLLRYLSTVGGALADDVAAETWVSVVKGLGRFRGDESKWKAWVFTIARARLVDARRRAARTPTPVDTDVALDGCVATDDVAGTVEDMFSTEAALALIGQLPEQQAEVVLLRYVGGLDVAHTARAVGKRPGAVRVAAHRGLSRLAELLAAREHAASQPGVTHPSPGTVRR
ncbi:MAG TPA: RNA polymerase sigma factor [Nocardioides sp.]|nr:RNA polymerase sigma factor [Nocardioides sp.]